MKIAKKRLQQAVARFKQGFADRPTRALDELLSSNVVCSIVDEEVGSYRERIYPPLTTLGLFIGQALSADGACQDAVARHLSERTAQGEHQCSLSSGPYCKARSRLPLSLIRRLAVSVGERLEQMSCKHWQWRGRSVKLLDGTTVSMPDTQANQAAYPQSGEQQPGLGFPLAMLVALISLSTGAVLRWASGPCRGKGSGEQALFRTLMPHLTAGDIILVDRLHCTYFTVAMLCERGVDILTRQHPRRLTDFRQGRRLGLRDQLVTWHCPQRPDWMDHETYARLPQQLTLRQTEVAGRVLVTTLTDARSVAPLDLDTLYRQRWQRGGRSAFDQGGVGHGHLAREVARHDRQGDSRLLARLQPGAWRHGARRCRCAADRAKPKFQRRVAIASGVSTTTALGRGQVCPHYERAPARRNQHDELADSTRTRRTARDQTKTQKPCPADSTSASCACRNHPCAAGLR